MRPRWIFLASLLAATLLWQDSASAEPTGDWLVGDGNATVRIRKCGSAFCGTIVWTRSAPGRDYKNPDPSKRRRSVIGIEVLSNMRTSGANSWTGTSYNAEDGQTYATQMTLQGDRSLHIRGCVPNGGICGSETWTKLR